MWELISVRAELKLKRADPVLEFTTALTTPPEQLELSCRVRATFFPVNKFDTSNLGERLSKLVWAEFKDSVGATGIIEIPISDLPNTLFSFISKVPMDSDMIISNIR